MNRINRNRKMRSTESIRNLLKETTLSIGDLIYPIFVTETTDDYKSIKSMPGIEQVPLGKLKEEITKIKKLGIQAVILFGVTNKKDELGSEAYSNQGIIQKAIRLIKSFDTDIIVIADTCLCEYTNHGHCGKINEKGELLNDESVELSTKVALSQALAGADIIAPSSCLDGIVHSIRSCLDKNGFEYLPVMSYAVKFASSFYGPFRDAADSTPEIGNRKSYQIPYTNKREAVRELESDIHESVDMVIVKPALNYMDILSEVRQETRLPVVAYNVSGEYAMVKAASQNGWINEKKIVMEILIGLKRAGADLIITYHAKEVAKWLNE